MAGFVELPGSVIESPHGLHSNARTFSAKGRPMICKAIGRRTAPSPGGCSGSLRNKLISALKKADLSGAASGSASRVTKRRKCDDHIASIVEGFFAGVAQPRQSSLKCQ